MLFARTQKAQDKVEAIDSYDKWLVIAGSPANPQGLLEYGQVLESSGHYARALEQFEAAFDALTQDRPTLTRARLRFEKARLLLAVDPENSDGMTEFSRAIEDGFADTDAIGAVLSDERIKSDNRDEIRRVWNDILIREREAAAQESETDENEGESGAS